MGAKFRHAGSLLEVNLVQRHPQTVLSVGGDSFAVRIISEGPGGEISAEIGGHVVSGWRMIEGNDVFVRLDGRSYRLERVVPGASDSDARGGDDLRATMPGVVVSVECEAGQAVAKGRTLLIIESMKMQTAIAAPRDGVVGQVHFAPDSSFEKGAVLISLQPGSE